MRDLGEWRERAEQFRLMARLSRYPKATKEWLALARACEQMAAVMQELQSAPAMLPVAPRPLLH
jgi:hypothetical protein